MMGRQPLGAYFENLEQRHNLPRGFLAKTRAIESSNGRNLVNPNSSARGDFQFIRSTAKSMGLQNPMDPYASADAAARLAEQNKNAIVRATGKQPDGADLYAAHQQGAGGFLKLLRGQSPGAQEMALNGGAGKTPGGFLSAWRSKFENAKPDNLGPGFTYQAPPPSTGGVGPTMANAAAMGGTAGAASPEVQGPPMPNAEQAAAMAKANTYNGGIMGLFGVGDQNAPGMGKDLLGKLGDMSQGPGGGQLGGIAKALGGVLGAGQTQTTQQPGITLQADNSIHTGDPSLMAYLDPRRRRAAMMGAA